MAYDEGLADQIRAVLSDKPHMVAKKMFGGLGFILNGNMAAGVLGAELLVRVPREQYAALLAEPHVRAFTMGKRVSRGWVMISPGGLVTDAALERWVALGVSVAESLPPK